MRFEDVLAVAGAQPSPPLPAPLALFAAGEQGFWFDPNDLSSMWQESTGTTPAAVGSPVGKILDKSGRGNHATQATSDNRPTLRESGGLRYLEFDGTNDSLVTPSIDLGGDAVTVFAGASKTSDASARAILTGGGAEQIALYAPATAAANYGFRSAGTAGISGNSASSFAAPRTSVLTGQGKISTDTNNLRENGVQIATAANDQGTGNYAAVAFHVGKRSTSSLFHSGNIYGICMVGRTVTAGEITALESYMAAKTGVTL